MDISPTGSQLLGTYKKNSFPAFLATMSTVSLEAKMDVSLASMLVAFLATMMAISHCYVGQLPTCLSMNMQRCKKMLLWPLLQLLFQSLFCQFQEDQKEEDPFLWFQNLRLPWLVTICVACNLVHNHRESSLLDCWRTRFYHYIPSTNISNTNIFQVFRSRRAVEADK